MTKPKEAQTRPFPKTNPDVVYGLAVKRLQAQHEQIHSLDAKIGNLLALGGMLVGVFAGFLALLKGDTPCEVLVLLGASGTAYLIVAGWPRTQ